MRAILLTLALVGVVGAADTEPGGKLEGKLTVKDLQGGFAGFNGKVYIVDTDGSFTLGNEARGRMTVVGKGKLDAKALSGLVAALKKFGADSLKDTGRPMANPRQITITYGKHTAVLNLPTTADLPKADDKDAAGRFAGIVNEVTGSLTKALPKKRTGKDAPEK